MGSLFCIPRAWEGRENRIATLVNGAPLDVDALLGEKKRRILGDAVPVQMAWEIFHHMQGLYDAGALSAALIQELVNEVVAIPDDEG